MTDIAVQHVMTTPGGTITFNDGSADQFYLSDFPGLDGTPARIVVDKTPFADGGILHPPFKDVRHFQPTGTLLITSTLNQAAIQTIRNDMAEDLRAAYESILTANGTWQWTPLGQSSRTLTIRRDSQAIEFFHVDGYQAVDFSFGLIAVDPDWT